MTKQDALSATIKKFTNLMDGDILPGVSVTNVINYYEALINNTSIPKDNRVSGIESNFIDDILEDHWYVCSGNRTCNISNQVRHFYL